jgi:signal transduction histidine kinase
MAPARRRGLFWQVYPTLLVSVVLVAVLGAMAWHMFGVAPMTPPPGFHRSMHAVRRFRLHSMGLLLTVATVVGVAAYPVIARLTRRLEALRLSVEAWGAGDLGRRAKVDGRDEIAAVAASFNAAADRADALLAAHRTLLAHASHELRSPLTRLAMAVEMMAGATESDLASAVRREIAELDALVEEILLASRLDHGGDLGELERVDCLALAAEEAARASVEMRAVPPGGVYEVMGSPRLLRRLIRNLIDNARKHGEAPVTVEVVRAGDITIAVHDRGRGIAPDLRSQVFEPFFRPGGRTEQAGGWGLGLSLVRQIAERHGGRAVCDMTGAGVTTFSVTLPAAPPNGAA